MQEPELITIDNLFTEDECRELILFYKQNSKRAHKWGSSFQLGVDMRHPYLKSVVDDIEERVVKHLPHGTTDWGFLVHWPILSYMTSHRDKASNKTIYTGIVNLNRDYDGGRTFFDDGTVIEPDIGKASFFDGRKYRHGVTQITRGERYTLALWFKQKEQHLALV